MYVMYTCAVCGPLNRMQGCQMVGTSLPQDHLNLGHSDYYYSYSYYFYYYCYYYYYYYCHYYYYYQY